MKTGVRKFRKKPVVIEALRYDGDNDYELDNFVGENDVIYRNMFSDDKKVFIETLEGDMRVRKGDFVIKGVNGEFYPCKPDIFEKTYEEVEE